MTPKFFRVVDSFAPSDRWFLGAPQLADGTTVDPRLFTEGRSYAQEQDFLISVKKGKAPLDFTLASFDMPVTKVHIAESMKAKAPNDVQLIPAQIMGTTGSYRIINVLTMLKAINEELSEITRWTATDGLKHRIGDYAGIGRLVLQADKITGEAIFRLKDWELPFIVRDDVKTLLQDLNTSGIDFEEIPVV